MLNGFSSELRDFPILHRALGKAQRVHNRLCHQGILVVTDPSTILFVWNQCGQDNPRILLPRKSKLAAQNNERKDICTNYLASLYYHSNGGSESC